MYRQILNQTQNRIFGEDYDALTVEKMVYTASALYEKRPLRYAAAFYDNRMYD